MSRRMVSAFLPALVAAREPTFNVFDVMHHGTHEKQLSNVFAWLLDPSGTHSLGDRFQRLFLEHVNRDLEQSLPGHETFSVRQEVDVDLTGSAPDIADLVLESQHAVLVVENYYTSDGHGHGYATYKRYAERDGKQGVVVMLCARVSSNRLTDGWQEAAVVSYSDLIKPLTALLERDQTYQQSYPDQRSFLRHLHDRYVKEDRLNDGEMVGFIEAMCSTGQARHYRAQNAEAAALAFSDSLREAALEQFHEGRAFLQRTKAELKAYVSRHLSPQLESVLGEGAITHVSANYAGIHQWVVNVWIGEHERGASPSFQIRFGPTAWHANNGDSHWHVRVTDPDYRHLFLSRVDLREIRQSTVTIGEAAAGIDGHDFRLRDEVLQLLASDSSPA